MAQSNIRAAYMRSNHVEWLTVETKIDLLVDANENIEDITIYWGDGEASTVSPFYEEAIPELNARQLFFQETHQYAYFGAFFIEAETCCWAEGINLQEGQNMIMSNYITTAYIQTLGTNLAAFPQQNIQIQKGESFEPYAFNPTFFDVDGDSLAYNLLIPFGSSNYLFPDEVAEGPSNVLNFSNATGDFNWDAPQAGGLYRVAFGIREYRTSILMSSSFIMTEIDIAEITNNEEITTSNITIYPNPTTETLYLSEETDQIQITTIFGQQLFNTTDRTKEINVEHLPSGMYWLQLRKSDQQIRMPFIKE